LVVIALKQILITVILQENLFKHTWRHLRHTGFISGDQYQYLHRKAYINYISAYIIKCPSLFCNKNMIILQGITVNELLAQIENMIDKKLRENLVERTGRETVYLTRAETARLLKISLPTLHDYTKHGWLVAYKIGRRVLYKKEELHIEQLQMYKHKKGGLYRR
jgi:excisionase family DNA binding protein